MSLNKPLSYKFLLVSALSSGIRQTLYFLRLVFPLNRLISNSFLILISPLHIFTYVIRMSEVFTSLQIRFWLVMLHHFIIFYELILTTRFLVEWFNINLCESGTIGQFIFDASEPYFKASQQILPRGLSGLLAFLLFDQIKFLIKLSLRSITMYGSCYKYRVWIEIFDLLGFALKGETKLPSLG